jgi:hypothetical protein
MLGDGALELDHQRYLHEQECEVANYEQMLAAQEAGKDEADGWVKGSIERMRPKLTALKQKLDELKQAPAEAWMAVLSDYKEIRADLRDSFKRLDQHFSGPPLD